MAARSIWQHESGVVVRAAAASPHGATAGSRRVISSAQARQAAYAFCPLHQRQQVGCRVAVSHHPRLFTCVHPALQRIIPNGFSHTVHVPIAVRAAATRGHRVGHVRTAARSRCGGRSMPWIASGAASLSRPTCCAMCSVSAASQQRACRSARPRSSGTSARSASGAAPCFRCLVCSPFDCRYVSPKKSMFSLAASRLALIC